jgi:hypothetical protein
MCQVPMDLAACRTSVRDRDQRRVRPTVADNKRRRRPPAGRTTHSTTQCPAFRAALRGVRFRPRDKFCPEAPVPTHGRRMRHVLCNGLNIS